MIKIDVRGNTNRTESFVRHCKKLEFGCLDKYGAEGVKALSNATPVDTGLTAASWEYEIQNKNDGVIRLIWRNTNVVKGIPVAVLIFYGHGTRHGGYVQGIDYINPALQPIFDKIAKDAWLEVVNS